MARRMVSDSIWKNEKYASLPLGARLLLIGLVTNADDQGRGKAHPAFLRAEIFPYDDFPLADISQWLQLIQANETAILYSVDGKDYYQLTNWWDYQSHPFAAPSEFSKPPAWCDRVRTTTKGRMILTFNWITSDGVMMPNTCDEHGKPIPLQKNGKPPVLPPDDDTRNQVIDHVVDYLDNHVVDQVEHQRESKRESKREREIETKTNASGADGGGDSSLSLIGWQEVMRAYESNIGSFTAMSSELVRASTEEHGATVVVDAITEAVKQNVRKWSYVDGILKRWKANGRNGESPKPAKPPPRQAQKITIFNQYTNQYEEKLL